MKKTSQVRNSPVSVSVYNCQKKLPVSVNKIKAVIKAVLSHESFKGTGEINVAIVDDKRISALNAQFLGASEPTDVLAFDISDSKGSIFGDIIVSADTAVCAAKEFHVPVASELYLYVAHGLLHLLGYKDHTPGAREKMNNRARLILRKVRVFP